MDAENTDVITDTTTTAASNPVVTDTQTESDNHTEQQIDPTLLENSGTRNPTHIDAICIDLSSPDDLRSMIDDSDAIVRARSLTRTRPTTDVSVRVTEDLPASRTPASQAVLQEALMTLNATRTELEAVRANHEAERRRREELEAMVAEKLRARDTEVINRQRIIEDLLEQQRSLQRQLNQMSQTPILNTQTLTTSHTTSEGHNTNTPVNRLGANLGMNTLSHTVDPNISVNLGLGYNLKPDTYDGTTPLREYLNQFNLIARANNWNNEKKMVALAAALRGKATSVLNCFKDSETFDLTTLLEKLEARFGEHLGSSSYSLFQNRRQKLGEDLPTLAADIEKLASLAYPEVSLEVQDKIACSQFITGIYHVGVRETLQLEHITSLKVALTRALEVKAIKEQNRNSNFQRNTRGSQSFSNSSKEIQTSSTDVAKQGQPFNHQEWLKNLECWGCHKKGHTPEKGN